MISATNAIKEMINSPVRKINAKVELFDESSTLVDTFTHDGKLIDFTVERVCEEGKFFGFGICQHVKVKLLDVNREVDYITTAHSMKIYYGVGNDYICAHPVFYITQSRRDENTNELTIYGYDGIYPAATRTINESAYNPSEHYRVHDIAALMATELGLNGMAYERLIIPNDVVNNFLLAFSTASPFDGNETLRGVLDDIAEVSQTIYYVDETNKLIFKRLSHTRNVDLVISKEDYIKLDTKNGKRLSAIVRATELGDNYKASIDATGSTAYVRDNDFWNVVDDNGYSIEELLDYAISSIGGLTIRQFDMEWRGNFLVEPGDRIDIATKDGSLVTSFLLDDTITYNGVLSQKTKWNYKEEEETESNPTSLGEVLKHTTAKVDKAAQEITLAIKKVDGYDEKFTTIEMDIDSIKQSVSKVDGFDNRITQLELDAEGITASVQQIQKNTEDRMDAMNEELETVMNKVEATMTPEAVEIKIQEAIGDGVNQITTETGFTFNDVGLTVSKTGSEMTTTITEDGMSVYKDGSEVLTADNTGVQAIDLRATTYLHIGTFSRFQDYEGGRTGCFWIV